MIKDQILLNRLTNQGICEKKFNTVSDIVKYFGAIQSQDLSAVKWALGLRIRNSTEKLIDKEINNADIVRTHVLRPTWHLVHKNDIRWMLKLTAPRVKKVIAHQYKKSGLTSEDFTKCNKIIKELVTGGSELTSNEIKLELAKSGLHFESTHLLLVLMNAQLDQIVCDGTPKDNQLTYACFDEKIPETTITETEHAIEELATRYFTSHGPATIYDFSRWSGLTVNESKRAVQSLQERGMNELLAEDEFYYFNTLIDESLDYEHFLLPRYDEYFNGYKDKSLFLQNHGVSWEPLGLNTIIGQGQIIGNWTRKVLKDTVQINFKFFSEGYQSVLQKLKHPADAYAYFLEKNLVLT